MDTNGSPKKNNWIQIASFVLIAMLTVETILLIMQNRELKSTIKAMTASPVEPLKAGDTIQPVKVQTLDGATTDLALSGKDPSQKYLVFVFSTTCPHCEKTMPVWSHIAGNAVAGGNVTIMGVSTHPLDVTKQYVGEKKPGFYIVSAAGDTSFGRKYKISGVPETILIRGDGVVVKSWIGELQPDQVEEIQTLLSARQALR